MRKNLYILCILAVLSPHSAFAETDGLSETSSTTVATQSLIPIHLQVTYPKFPDGSFQSALKVGDLFSVQVKTADILLHDVMMDLSALELSETTPHGGSSGLPP